MDRIRLVLRGTLVALWMVHGAHAEERPAEAVPYCAFVAAVASAGESVAGPKIDRVQPMMGHAGNVVTITGLRLSGATAIFRDLAATTLASSDTQLVVKVPPSTTGPIVVRSPDGQTRTRDAFLYVHKVEDNIVFPVPVGGGEWFPAALFLDLGRLSNIDDNAKFLQKHWEQPLRPQGDAPDSYSLIERSIKPRTCKTCHEAQYELWKDSLHARSASELVRWNAREHGTAFVPSMQVLACRLERDSVPEGQRELAQGKLDELTRARSAVENSCRRCHDPIAENGPWTEVEMSRATGDPEAQPVRDGVQCAVCHVRAHQRYGPPSRKPPVAPVDGVPPPHNGFQVSRAYEDSRFCAGCHTFSIRIDTGIVGNPFEEWRVSPFAARGVSCQNCHMPDRKHLFRGIHDRDTTLGGLAISLKLKEDGGLVTATASVTSTRVGHMFPTYSIPRVHVRLFRSAPLVTRKLPEGGLMIDEYAIGREIDLKRQVEKWDHRLAPGASVVRTRSFPPQAGERVTLRIDVVPRDDYEGPLKARLALPPDQHTEKVRGLLAHEEGLRYRLVDITLPVPERGATVEKRIREGVWQ